MVRSGFQEKFSNSNIKGLEVLVVGTLTLFGRLANSDFHWVLNLGKCLAREHFESNEEVIVAVDEYFAEHPGSSYQQDGCSVFHN